MKHRVPRRHTLSGAEMIVRELRELRLLFYQLVAYKKREENRNQIFADIASGMVPMLQKYVADALAPRHPVMPHMPSRHNPYRNPVTARSARAKRKQ